MQPAFSFSWNKRGKTIIYGLVNSRGKKGKKNNKKNKRGLGLACTVSAYGWR